MRSFGFFIHREWKFKRFRELSCVKDDIARAIAVYKVPSLGYVKYTRPTVMMNGFRFAGKHGHFQNSDFIVLQQYLVILFC